MKNPPTVTPLEEIFPELKQPDKEQSSMRVRAKFRINEVTMYNETYGKVKLTAVHETNTPENQRFTKATPNGTIEMYVDNPTALEQFKPGRYVYADFTEAEV